ncbi:potassium channel subfamily K member 16-like isoform X1 [Acipenser ruthenus]|uniref:potassium channel subfamily K member 16-like isoform X1 n=1 Tax=Acipenser ruthenus TaxID=7906 RepID=UPI00145A2232|nr:potassium channel subfamily K member 16-like isoform X1 [Acipenser ruthenus]
MSQVVSTSLMLTGYLSYLLVGAAVFQALEQNYEKELKTDTFRQKLMFLENYTCLTKEAVEKFVEVMTEAFKNGVNPIENKTSNYSNWDFSSSFFFVETVVTTIGYGYLAPRTAGGQIFCVFFAMFGIPLNLIVLNHVGKTLSSCTDRLGKRLYSRGMQKKTVKILTIIFFVVIGVVLFLALPPLMFCLMEDWSYREGVYYAFITLSTIGFGDYVVGVNHKPYYRALVAFWILFGMAWLALLFNLLTTFYEDTEKKISKVHQKRKAAKAKKNTANGSQPTTPVSEEEVAMETEGTAQQATVSFLELDNSRPNSQLA